MSKRTIEILVMAKQRWTCAAPDDASPDEIAQLMRGHEMGKHTTDIKPLITSSADVALDAEAIGPEFTREQLDALRSG